MQNARALSALSLVLSAYRTPFTPILARDFRLPRPDNIILLGHLKGNPWLSMFEDRLNFYYDFDWKTRLGKVLNRHPLAGEETAYAANYNRNGYCVVACLPKGIGQGEVVLIFGSDVSSLEAGGRFVTSEKSLDQFYRRIGTPAEHAPRHIEVLLRTTLMHGSSRPSIRCSRIGFTLNNPRPERKPHPARWPAPGRRNGPRAAATERQDRCPRFSSSRAASACRRARSSSPVARPKRWGRIASKPCQSSVAVEQRTSPSTAAARADLVLGQPEQGVAQALGSRIDGQSAAVPSRGALGIGKLRAARIAQANEKSDQLAVQAIAHLRSQAEQILPAPGLREEIEDAGRGLGVAGGSFKNLAERRDGLGRIAVPVALDLGDAQPIRAPLDPRHIGVRPPSQGHDQVGPALGRFEDFDGARQGFAIVGVGRQALFPQAERAIDLAARVGQFRRFAQKPAAHARGRFQAGLAFEHVQSFVGAAQIGEQGGQLAHGREHLFGLGGVAGQGLAIESDGGGGSARCAFPRSGRLPATARLAGVDRSLRSRRRHRPRT